MSRSIHFISTSIPAGSGPPDAGCLPCSGLSGRALVVSPNCSHANRKLIYNPKYLSLKCSSRYIACNATSSNDKRNPGSSRPNRHRVIRDRNNNNGNNEEREDCEDLEGSETLSSRNESVSPNPKFQATAIPGPMEKEIVEIFKKVQIQLRERASVKEEGKKVEYSKGKGLKSETVDSLLELLRKHSVQQGKKSNISVDNNNNEDLILDQQEKVVLSTEAKSTSISDSTNHAKIQGSSGQDLSRPKSSFHKKSPVPKIKSHTGYPKGDFNSISVENLDNGKNRAGLEPEEGVDIEEVESDSESDVGSLFSDGNELDQISEDEISEYYENVPLAQEQEKVESSDLSEMKVAELREVAKSRGMKGYSKLKKSELIELLSE